MTSVNLGEQLGDGYYDALQHAINISDEGYAIEFGVATGRTLMMISKKMSVIGFDSFEGLPEYWRAGFEKGVFAGPVPDVPDAEIVVGWFEDVLPKWIEHNKHILNNLALVHIDCDLYSSTKTIFDNIGPYLNEGTLVVFDEYHGYPGWLYHEHKAWTEFVKDTDTKFKVIGFGPEQLVVEIK